MSDALTHAPSFDEMVGLLEKLFKDSLEMTKAFTAEEIEAGWQRYKTLNHLYQDESIWVKANIKPPFNEGVLVFIPGEDNHITAGMWDIDMKWVLLDEYRTPECEVTHWMKLPPIPAEYECKELPEEITKALQEIAEKELPKELKMDSIFMVGRVKDRFKELEAKGWDWRSFYNGWLEGRADMFAQVKGIGKYKDSGKEEAVAFMNWTLSGDCDTYNCTDEDQWTNINDPLDSIATAQLYDIYKQQNR